MNSSSQQGGFTLIEILMALALISGSCLTLLYLRVDAVSRADAYRDERRILQLAQEKLDQVTYGLEEERSGKIIGPPEIEWSVTVEDVSETDAIFLEYTIRFVYNDEGAKEQEFELMTWVLPDENDPILQEIELKNSDDEEAY